LLGLVTALIWWVPYLWSCVLRDWLSGKKHNYPDTRHELLHSGIATLIQTIIYLAGWWYAFARIFGG
jgi:hypothetical protein